MVVPQEAFDDRIGWLKKAWSAQDVQDFCEEIEAMRPRRESNSAARRRSRFRNPDEFGPDYINAYDQMEVRENREYWAKHGGRLAYLEDCKEGLEETIAAIKSGKARFV
jgi:hypothetical protein